MKPLLAILVLLLTTQVAFSNLPAAVTKQKNASAIQRKATRKKVPQGAVIKRNRATLKPGFKFVRNTENLVVLQGKDDDIQSASFSCGCDSGQGGCKVVTQGKNLWCEAGTCSDCVLEVTMEAKGATSSSPTRR